MRRTTSAYGLKIGENSGKQPSTAIAYRTKCQIIVWRDDYKSSPDENVTSTDCFYLLCPWFFFALFFSLSKCTFSNDVGLSFFSSRLQFLWWFSLNSLRCGQHLSFRYSISIGNKLGTLLVCLQYCNRANRLLTQINLHCFTLVWFAMRLKNRMNEWMKKKIKETN